jgi:hypothetical protein
MRPVRVWRTPERGQTPLMFVFFSNRLGCFGSVLVSVIGTIVLLIVFDVI